MRHFVSGGNTKPYKMVYGKAQVNGRGRVPPSTEDRMCFRKLMEQCDLFAVFDGHSGSGAVRYTVEFLPLRIQEAFKRAGSGILTNVVGMTKILQEVFIEHDKDLARNMSKVHDSGTTATVAIITPSHIVVAYVGDSPCFLMDPSKGLILPGGEMGKHEPTLAVENERIQRAGGTVEIDEMGVPRVDGLMVSRAFGDFGIKFRDMKNPPYTSDWRQMKVTAHPDVIVWDRPDHALLAIMSDGLVESDTIALKPLPQVAADIFRSLKSTEYDLPAAAQGVLAGHVHAAVGSHASRYDGDDLSIILADVGRLGGSRTVISATPTEIKTAIQSMTAKPQTRKFRRGQKGKTGKMNRLVKMFNV